MFTDDPQHDSSPPDAPNPNDPYDTPRNHRLLIEEAIRIEERIIYEARQRIRTLQTKRNATAPVSRLPHELLAHTFLLVRDASADLAWLPCVLHVCTAWRTHALSFASLWSRIKVRRHQITATFLERSARAPLSLSISLKVTGDRSFQRDRQRAVDAAMGQIARTRHLSVRFSALYPDAVSPQRVPRPCAPAR